jgi:hypothetical protein
MAFLIFLLVLSKENSAQTQNVRFDLFIGYKWYLHWEKIKWNGPRQNMAFCGFQINLTVASSRFDGSHHGTLPK